MRKFSMQQKALIPTLLLIAVFSVMLSAPRATAQTSLFGIRLAGTDK